MVPNSSSTVISHQQILKDFPSFVVLYLSEQRRLNIKSLQVVREHDPLGRDVELFRRHFYSDGRGPTAKGCNGAELVDGLVIEDRDYKLVKTRFSAFFATHLHSLLQSCGIKSLVVVGKNNLNLKYYNCCTCTLQSSY